MAFSHRYTGEGLVILATPTGGAELTLSDDYTSFGHNFSVDNVDVTAGNEIEKSKLTTKEDLSFSLDVFDGDVDTWNALLDVPTGYMEVYPRGLTGSEYFGFNYVIEGGDRSTGTDAAATLSMTGSRSGAMVVDFGSDPGGNRKLVFTTQPTNTASGAKIDNIVVKSETFASVVLANDQTTLITLAIGTNPGGGVLSGVVQARVINGVATFPGVIITGTGTGYTLTATADNGYTSATSNTFNIT